MEQRALHLHRVELVGRERRKRLSQLAWCGEGCFDSRRRVNTDVMRSQSESGEWGSNEEKNVLTFYGSTSERHVIRAS